MFSLCMNICLSRSERQEGPRSARGPPCGRSLSTNGLRNHQFQYWAQLKISPRLHCSTTQCSLQHRLDGGCRNIEARIHQCLRKGDYRSKYSMSIDIIVIIAIRFLHPHAVEQMDGFRLQIAHLGECRPAFQRRKGGRPSRQFAEVSRSICFVRGSPGASSRKVLN